MTSPTPPSLRISLFRRWLVLNLLFSLLPMLLIAWGLSLARQGEDAARIRGIGEDLQDLQLAILDQAAVPKYFKSWFEREMAKALERPNATTILTRMGTAFRRRLPQTADFFVVDPQGRLVSSTCPPPVPVTEITTLYHHLRNRQAGKEYAGDLERQWPRLTEFIGPHASHELIVRFNNGFFLSQVIPTRTHFAWLVSPNGGVFARFYEEPDWRLALLKYLSTLFQKKLRKKGVRLGTWDTRSLANANPDLGLALARFRDTGERWHQGAREVTAIWEVSPGIGVWAAAPFTPHRAVWSGHWLPGILGLLVLGFAGSTWYLLRQVLTGSDTTESEGGAPAPDFGRRGKAGQERRGSSGGSSIRARLTGLFFCVALPPLVLVAVFSHLYQSQAATSAREAIGRNHLQILNGIGQDFLQNTSVLEGRLNKDLASASFAPGPGQAFLLQTVAGIQRSTPDVEMNIYNEAGEIVWSSVAISSERRNRTHRILSGLFVRVLKRWNGDTSPSPTSTADLLIEMLGLRKSPVDDLQDNIQHITQYSWYTNECFAYFTPILGKDSLFTYILAMFWKKSQYEKAFLLKILERMRREQPRSLLIGIQPIERDIFPSHQVVTPELRTLWRRVQFLERPARGRAIIDQRPWIISACKSKELSETYLFFAEPEDALRNSQAVIRRNFAWFLAGVLAITLTIGFMLSRQFLAPLQTLEHGLVALGEHRFQTQLPVGQQDEFGELLTAFNAILADFGEMRLAQTIQENLLPAAPLQHQGYTIAGRQCFANRLGGDFFDYRVLPDQRLLVLIGDVSGHGVAAALIMAMMKGVIEDQCRRELSLSGFFGAMNQVLFRNFKRNWTLSCFALLLDPVRHHFEYAGAGHPFPWQFRKDAAPLLLNHNCFPLGTRARLDVVPGQGSFAVGDLLLLFTDGLTGSFYPDTAAELTPLAVHCRAAHARSQDDPLTAVLSVLTRELRGDPEDDRTLLLITRS